ncbi:putative inositol-1(or 4)-monophosphatase / fructose-1,6-bisphosphatase, archaeal-type [Natrialba magadii ATCC 43099]|uniref:fructose-bisphosphatase n=1 Tax=Natrialba magadii (strain ATCC 43099 / DSM 3394 / CCM 3739 / CIP 104546 / IAM 13178 / JCM 8861 / NBRC 102185 / NCIMB 2190 / MS3) TaxID=547559 RepID=D3SZD8_NATMM|nr:inositol monophosphatase [Natrialba magadii]ADD04272.1 putative inositol-1(or 4)-monophosphatase / fructose-1,6-bisphosphatase, archaeal-type [Natrialba magadii ATCC 43099]ELY26674.1 inositol-phosphate phosphatase [Natrialba magadii ATCC 43099]
MSNRDGDETATQREGSGATAQRRDTAAPRRATVATEAATAGADIAHDAFRTDLNIEYKDGKTDVVTQSDRDAQDAVIDVIREFFPEDPIVGEENDALKAVPEEGPAWIIDPIDGTNNYVNEIRAFGTAVAAVVDGEPVAATNVFPALSDTYQFGPDGVFRNGEALSVSGRTDPEASTVCPTYWWDFDQRDEYTATARELVTRFGDIRRFGCAQLELAMVAAGALEGVVTNRRANAWDTVAGVGMIREAGGVVTDLEGERWRHDSDGLVASNGESEIHEEVLAAARAIESEGN